VLNQVQNAVEDVGQGPGQLAGGPSPFLALCPTLQCLIQRVDEVIVVAGLLFCPAITLGARRCPRPGCHNPDHSSPRLEQTYLRLPDNGSRQGYDYTVVDKAGGIER